MLFLSVFFIKHAACFLTVFTLGGKHLHCNCEKNAARTGDFRSPRHPRPGSPLNVYKVCETWIGNYLPGKAFLFCLTRCRIGFRSHADWLGSPPVQPSTSWWLLTWSQHPSVRLREADHMDTIMKFFWIMNEKNPDKMCCFVLFLRQINVWIMTSWMTFTGQCAQQDNNFEGG